LRLFLDSSVLLAACGSQRGASRLVFTSAAAHGWELLVSPYARGEVAANLAAVGAAAVAAWPRLQARLVQVPDVLTADRPVVFSPTKDRPILLSALAWADVLLTLDRADFMSLLGQQFYELRLRTPGMFLTEERAAGHVRLVFPPA
jgi:predicted nucleic acid-binding protein